jgi:hypothetical protein
MREGSTLSLIKSPVMGHCVEDLHGECGLGRVDMTPHAIRMKGASASLISAYPKAPPSPIPISSMDPKAPPSPLLPIPIFSIYPKAPPSSLPISST